MLVGLTSLWPTAVFRPEGSLLFGYESLVQRCVEDDSIAKERVQGRSALQREHNLHIEAPAYRIWRVG